MKHPFFALLLLVMLCLTAAPAAAQDSSCFDGLELITLTTAGRLRVIRTLKIPQTSVGATINTMAWSPDGRYLAVATAARVYVYDVAQLEQPLYIVEEGSTHVEFSPNSQYLMTGFCDYIPDRYMGHIHACYLRFWSTVQGVLLASRIVPAIRLASFLSDDTLVLWDDERIRLWNWQQGQQLASFKAYIDWYDYISSGFSPDHRFLAVGTGGPENEVYVWQVGTGKPFLRTHGFSAALAFSPDGRFLIGASRYGGTTEVHSFPNNQQVDWFFSNAYIGDIQFSPDKSVVAQTENPAGSDLNVLRLWAFRPRPLAEQQPYDYEHDATLARFAFKPSQSLWANISQLAFNPQGTVLASFSLRGKMIVFWGVPREEDTQ